MPILQLRNAGFRNCTNMGETPAKAGLTLPKKNLFLRGAFDSQQRVRLRRIATKPPIENLLALE
jgi:hypothetical protein